MLNKPIYIYCTIEVGVCWMLLLDVVDLKLEFKEIPVLRGISFQVYQKDCIGLLGSSGSGKTSLFRILNLLQSPSQGKVMYLDRDTLSYSPTALRKRIGYVMQKPHLFEDTVVDNLLYPYFLLKTQPDYAVIHRYLEKVNLSESILQKKPTELSGGEQQRIALIRSLLIQPHILLLDEFTAALDEENTIAVEKMILAEQAEKNVTVLFISHQASQARRLANKILHLEKGKIAFYGTKEVYFTSKDVEA